MNNTKKLSCWLTILILIALGISANPHQVLTRTPAVSRALSPTLSSYEVIRMEPGEIEQQVRTTGELRFRFDETDFYFNLEPHDMRTPNYRAIETGPGGVKRTLPRQPVHTFKGVLAGREEVRGRFTLTGGGVEGVVYAPEGRYYVEPLRNYVPDASGGELVIYRDSDIKHGEAPKCIESLPRRLERGVEGLASRIEAAAPLEYEVEVATEADYEYVQAWGGSENANREIEGILNQIDAIYQRELLLRIRISFQSTWATEDDPYTTTNKGEVVDEFGAYWNANFADKHNYDLAHLWTDRPGISGGSARIATLCIDRSRSYGFSALRWLGPGKYHLTAHEISHNLGGTHVDQIFSPVSGCGGTIMDQGYTWSRLTFCEFSRRQITSRIALNNNCLTPRPIGLQPSTGLSARAVSSSRIDLNWQDNSTNETGFRILRRRGGSPEWAVIGTAAANVTSFSDSGSLLPHTTYRYRLQAFNATEISAFSNEAVATTLPEMPSGVAWRIDTIAGSGVGDDGPAVAARLQRPEGVAVAAAGNVYIADTGNHRIRRVDPFGTITTVAGGGRGPDHLPADTAWLDSPSGVALDGSGNLYIADSRNHRIRRVDATGTVASVAGSHSLDYSGDHGPAIAAVMDHPKDVAAVGTCQSWVPWINRTTTEQVAESVAMDGSCTLYIADTENHRIRRVDSSGTITTVAGTGERGAGGDGGPAVAAALNGPEGVAVDAAGNLYIADSGNHRIRRVDVSGTVTTIAGTGRPGYSGDGGPAAKAQLGSPSGVAVDDAGNLYIAETGTSRIRRVDVSGTITTIAGTGRFGYSGDGGPAVMAQLGSPVDVAVDDEGNVYIADTLNSRIRRVDPSGTITTIAGTGEPGFTTDGGPATAAQIDRPQGVAVGGDGNLYIADTENHRISRVTLSAGAVPAGTITAVAGNQGQGYSGDSGPAPDARLRLPSGVAADGSGNVYIADTWNSRIRRVDVYGSITTIAGTGVRGGSGDGGPADKARLHLPAGLALDRDGNVHVADVRNHRIRILTRIASPVTLPPPTGLTATAVSGSRINLSWRDNGVNETGFSVQRRGPSSVDWVDVGTTAADVTMFSDTGLAPQTIYFYRVRAFDNARTSGFSNAAHAWTLSANEEEMPLTVTRFTPASGPPGTRVTLTGTGFLGVTAVRFNGVDASSFEVQSGTSIEAVVPFGASSGPISVVASGKMAASAESFTVTVGFSSRFFLPIVLKARGLAGSFFTSELTLTNRGTATADIQYSYTASVGTGSGTAVDSLEPGRQKVIPDAIAYLASLGVPIGGGSAGGTLMVDFSSLSSTSDAAVTVRVATPVEDGSGRAGLAYPGLAPNGLLTGPAFITGLRQNSQDRSNVAVQHAGGAGAGALTVKVTIFSGDPATAGRSVALNDRTLSPGEFHQYNGILNRAGFDNGYVRVERVDGTAPFYAYGVINDQVNSDGSFVFPVAESSLVGSIGQTLPVIIETGNFQSELTLTNFSASQKQMDIRFVADAIANDDDTAAFSLTLMAGEQRILPNLVRWLRQQGVGGIGPAGPAHVGALFATPAQGDMSGIVIGARTGAPDKRGGQYSLFYNGVPYGSGSVESAWIYGLQQNAENRSNLALVNTGEIDNSSSTFEITVYDGSGKSQPRTKTVTLGPRRWTQQNGILGKLSQGYVQVRKITGNNPFVAYGVINDGGRPGERSGDGAFLPAQE